VYVKCALCTAHSRHRLHIKIKVKIFVSALCPLMLVLGDSLGREYELCKVTFRASVFIFMFVKRR